MGVIRTAVGAVLYTLWLDRVVSIDPSPCTIVVSVIVSIRPSAWMTARVEVDMEQGSEDILEARIDDGMLCFINFCPDGRICSETLDTLMSGEPLRESKSLPKNRRKISFGSLKPPLPSEDKGVVKKNVPLSSSFIVDVPAGDVVVLVRVLVGELGLVAAQCRVWDVFRGLLCVAV